MLTFADRINQNTTTIALNLDVMRLLPLQIYTLR